MPLEETVTFDPAALEERQCYDIVTVQDDVVEPIELITVELTNANGVIIATPVAPVGIIDDNDRKFSTKV